MGEVKGNLLSLISSQPLSRTGERVVRRAGRVDLDPCHRTEIVIGLFAHDLRVGIRRVALAAADALDAGFDVGVSGRSRRNGTREGLCQFGNGVAFLRLCKHRIDDRRVTSGKNALRLLIQPCCRSFPKPRAYRLPSAACRSPPHRTAACASRRSATPQRRAQVGRRRRGRAREHRFSRA